MTKRMCLFIFCHYPPACPDVWETFSLMMPAGRRMENKSSMRRGNELFLAKRDGSESHRLVTLTGPASWPRWSPDGKLLRFTVDGLWEVASDRTGFHPLLSGWNSTQEQSCGNWTPAGKYFVFETDRGHNEAT